MKCKLEWKLIGKRPARSRTTTSTRRWRRQRRNGENSENWGVHILTSQYTRFFMIWYKTTICCKCLTIRTVIAYSCVKQARGARTFRFFRIVRCVNIKPIQSDTDYSQGKLNRVRSERQFCNQNESQHEAQSTKVYYYSNLDLFIW